MNIERIYWVMHKKEAADLRSALVKMKDQDSLTNAVSNANGKLLKNCVIRVSRNEVEYKPCEWVIDQFVDTSKFSSQATFGRILNESGKFHSAVSMAGVPRELQRTDFFKNEHIGRIMYRYTIELNKEARPNAHFWCILNDFQSKFKRCITTIRRD